MNNQFLQHDFVKKHLQRIEEQLACLLPAINTPPTSLHEAMRYCVLKGGKRIRALLVYASGTCFGVSADALDLLASAVEIIHAYSLVHDDLPAMDDDSMRRGQPSCHKAFSEATAILVGDALQSLAFELLTRPSPHYSCEIQLNIMHQLSLSIGSRGMVGGQQLDIDYKDKPVPETELKTIQSMKTGALIRASIVLGTQISQYPHTEHLEELKKFGDTIGLAFQIKDDILDQEQNSDKAHSDTFNLLAAAEKHLTAIPQDTTLLRMIARYVVSRSH